MFFQGAMGCGSRSYDINRCRLKDLWWNMIRVCDHAFMFDPNLNTMAKKATKKKAAKKAAPKKKAAKKAAKKK